MPRACCAASPGVSDSSFRTGGNPPDVFMDSAGFLALWDAGDAYHTDAVRLQEALAGKRRRFWTTDHHFLIAGFVPLLNL